MSRLAVLVTIVLALVLAACSAGDDAKTATPAASGSATPRLTLTPVATTLPSSAAGSPGPVPSGWTTFHAYEDCLVMSYPADWQLSKPNALTENTAYCPNGAQVFSRVVDCSNPQDLINVTDVLKILSPVESGRTATSAWMVVYGAPKRCPDLKGYFEATVIDQQQIAKDIQPRTDAVIAGYPARCTTMTLQVDSQDEVADVCGVDTGQTIYLIYRFAAVDRRDAYKPTLDAMIDSLRFTIVATPTPAPKSGTPTPVSS